MMNCTDIQTRLDAFLDHDLGDREMQAVDKHIEHCPACMARLQKERRFRDTLKQIPVRGPAEGFTDRALAAVTEAHRHEHHRAGFIKGFGTAIAAGLALWLVVGQLPDTPQHQAPARQEIRIAVQEVQTVKLAFQTVSALDDARITIRLPEHVELIGYEGRRELAWNTNLKKGSNILKLPIRANTLVNGQIQAQIEHRNQLRTITIDLEVAPSGMTMEPFALNIV